MACQRASLQFHIQTGERLGRRGQAARRFASVSAREVLSGYRRGPGDARLRERPRVDLSAERRATVSFE